MAEKGRGIMGGEDSPKEKFPVGMRVLAVDDDPICLKVLETMLLRCQYHVTTTNQAIKALNMLRENKDKFDLVISDVHMPDMDGFKLLELVGLEMDLPVIMLSANGETKAVMKGITHGACDYLLKPVRIEELRNIWQHVVRRRKFDRKDQTSIENEEDNGMVQASNCEGMQGGSGPIDSNGNVSRKRKDQINEDEDDDCEEGNHESEDPSSQKKPRVVWSVELHRKFVAAVNQLGIDKAVPKRILDIMNVDKLTRENVASHLQKYRLYLKRLSAVASSQQASISATLGGRDTPYIHMGPYTDFGNLHGLAQFQTNGVSNKSSSNILDLTGLTPGMVKNDFLQCGGTTNPMNDYSAYQNIAATVNHQKRLFHGISTSLEQDHMQQKAKGITESHNDLQDTISCAPKNTFIDSANKSFLLHGGFCNQASFPISSTSAKCLQINSSPSTNLPGLDKCDTWKNFASLNVFNANSFPLGVSFGNCNMNSNNIEANLTSSVSSLNGNPSNGSSNTLLMGAQNPLIRPDIQCQTSLLGDNSFLMSSKRAGITDQKLNDPKRQHALEPNLAFNSSLNSIADGQRLKNRFFNRKDDTNMINNEPIVDTIFITPYSKSSKPILESRFGFCEDSMLGASNNCNLDDLMNAIIKSERDDIGFTDSEIPSDPFSLGTCL